MRIDQGDAVGHIGENFFAEHHFALDPPCGLDLAPIEFATQPGENSGDHDQPSGEQRHPLEKIAHRLIGNGFRLLYHRHPAGRLNRAEGINVTLLLEMTVLALADLLHQHSALGRHSFGAGLKTFRENSGAILIEYLAKRLVCKLDRRQTAAHSFDQDRDPEITDESLVGCSHGADNIGCHSMIGLARVHRRNECPRCRQRAVAPKRRTEVVTDQFGVGRHRSDETPLGIGDKHSVDARMRKERLVEPLLAKPNRVRIGQIFRDLRQGLIVLDQITFAAEIVADQVSHQLHESLAVAQDFRFQRSRQDRVGNNQR